MKTSTDDTRACALEGGATPMVALAIEAPPIMIVTRMPVSAPVETVWNSLMFYESIEQPPPFYLQLMLPRPISTQGAKSAVGDQAICLYEGGRLLKRVTQIDHCRLYEFSVIEQHLVVGRGVRLCGGSYALRGLSMGRTELSITTRYSSGNRPRWLVRPIERWVCHVFHRHLLRSIKTKAEAQGPAPAPEPT